eukprot:10018742-Alexandrium_andersonii.AAC.1
MAITADYHYHNHHADVALKFGPALKFRPLQYGAASRPSSHTTPHKQAREGDAGTSLFPRAASRTSFDSRHPQPKRQLSKN